MVHTSFVCFDTETTALVENLLVPLDRQPQIIEFAAVQMEKRGNDWIEINSLDVLIKPTVAVTDEIQKITNIDLAELAKAEPFSVHQHDIVNIFKGIKFRIGHNVTFDEAMLDFEFARLGVGPVWRAVGQRRRCTVELNEHVFGRRAKLNEVYEHYFGEPIVGAHRAMTDVKANAKIVVAMIEKGLV